MKRNTMTSIALFIIVAMMGACDNDAWDQLPEPIVDFVCEYFPFGEVAAYSSTDQGSTVSIKGGATLCFDSQYEWTDVDGHGQPLPQNFLYDKLPPTLYDYLLSIEHLDQVYRAVRTPVAITLKLFDSQLEYDQHTHTITYPDAEQISFLP